MIDDLRNSATFQDDDPLFDEESRPAKRTSGLLMGMTAPQRLVVALLLFFMVFVLGAFCLVITERVVPPLY
ncbi:MAG TPA: hypothetical protein VLH85_08875 [Levilinea sp.]|nr:hypothetical protein [Levilinea sp.]